MLFNSKMWKKLLIIKLYSMKKMLILLIHTIPPPTSIFISLMLQREFLQKFLCNILPNMFVIACLVLIWFFCNYPIMSTKFHWWGKQKKNFLAHKIEHVCHKKNGKKREKKQLRKRKNGKTLSVLKNLLFVLLAITYNICLQCHLFYVLA